MIKAYFACSIRGGGDTSNYVAILDELKRCEVEVISEVFVHDAIEYGGSPLPNDQIYERDIAMIEDCDVVIAEVSNPSLGVGYELAYAEKIGKPVLCLFSGLNTDKLSAMITGNRYFIVASYEDEPSLASHVSNFLTRLPQTLQKSKDH